ncbi:MAG: hypothetical protein U1E87_08870 [Alphaproteobacteria bacterium]
MRGKYDTSIDPESAYELLQGNVQGMAAQARRDQRNSRARPSAGAQPRRRCCGRRRSWRPRRHRQHDLRNERAQKPPLDGAARRAIITRTVAIRSSARSPRTSGGRWA